MYTHLYTGPARWDEGPVQEKPAAARAVEDSEAGGGARGGDWGKEDRTGRVAL